MHRPLVLATAAIAFMLGACGSTSTEGESAMTDETNATTPAAANPSGAPTTGSAPDAPPRIADEPDTTEGAEPAPSDAVDAETDTPLSTPERLGLLAATDLAERLGVGVDDVEVVEVQEVTWRDASLGCPQKDFQYPQVLTPGVRIALSAQGSTYSYHAGAGRDPFYCVDPQAPA